MLCICWKNKINYLNSENLSDALNADITIASAIISILISMVLFFRDMYTDELLYKYAFYIWTGSLMYMLLCTYRSVSNMMELMFSEDKLIPEYFKPEDSEKKLEIEEKKELFAQEIDKI